MALEKERAALEKERADNMKLRDQLEAANAVDGGNGRGGGEDPELIARPSGTAGTNFSIQIAMGLGGTGRRYEKYKAIQVGSAFKPKVIREGRPLTARNIRDVSVIWSGMHVLIGSCLGLKYPLGRKPCYSRL